MSNLKRALFISSLLIGGIVCYCWYALSAQADKIISALAPDLQVRYDFIRVSPFGAASVENVEIRAGFLPDTLKIDALELDSLNTFGLLNMARSLLRDEWPKALHVRIKNANFDLYGAAFTQRNITPTYDSLGCNDVAVTNLDALRGMGFRRLHFNGIVQYNVDEFSNQLIADAKIDAQNMATLSLQAVLVVPDSLGIMQMRLVPPQLARAELDLEDHSFNQAKSELCSRKIGIPKEAFFAENTRQAARMMRSRGMTFSQDWISAYGTFIATQGRLVVTVAPEKPFKLSELGSDESKGWLDKLQLAVQINGQAVNDLTVSFHEPEVLPPEPTLPPISAPTVAAPPPSRDSGFVTLPVTATATPVATATTTPVAPSPAQNSPPATPAVAPRPVDVATTDASGNDWFTLIPPAQRAFETSSVGLAAYIDRMVVVTMIDGRRHKGQLKTVGSRDLQLTMQIQKGTVGFSIAFEDIKEVRVLP